MNFKDLNISDDIINNLKQLNFLTPTLVQEKTIPLILDNKDLIVQAKTGSGKTFSFLLPIIEKLNNKNENREIKGLIIVPTRELCIQILDNAKNIASKSTVKFGAIYGGVKEAAQKQMLANKIDVLISTPGRLLDYLEQHIIDLKNINYFVLDEADKMFELGLKDEVKKIITFLPNDRQSLLFSATITNELKRISKEFMKNTILININNSDIIPINIIHRQILCNNKNEDLLKELRKNEIFSSILFCSTKNKCEEVYKYLKQESILVDILHGDIKQENRQKSINNFRSGKIQVLVATDVASRGIESEFLTHVINYDIPEQLETFLHRVGRCGRNNKKGTSIILVSKNDDKMFKKIIENYKIKFE